MLSEFNEKIEKCGPLTQNVPDVTLLFNEPSLWPERSTEADKDGATVVLVWVVDGAADEFGCELYIGRLDDKALGVGAADLCRDSAISKRAWIALAAPSVNDVVVSEVRHIVATRLTAMSLSV